MSITPDGIKLYTRNRKTILTLLVLACVEFLFTAVFVILLAGDIVFPRETQATANAVSKVLSYQGRLTDASGNPLGGSGTAYCFRFSIYDAASAGTKLWPAGTPTSQAYNITNGIINAGVGDADDLSTFNFYDSDTVYLQTEVNTTTGTSTCTSGTWEALAPRQRVDATAYARATRDVYGSILKTVNASSKVQIGAGTGGVSPILLNLDVKNVQETIGGSCTTNGTLWYNSSNGTSLICNNSIIELIGGTSTIAAIKETSAGSPITTGTVHLSGSNNITISQTNQSFKFSVPNMIYAAGVSNTGNTAGNTGTQNNATLVFAGSNNITVSQSTGAGSVHTIWISGGAGGAAGSNTFGMSNLGNTAGTSGTINGSAAQFLVVGGAGIIGSQSVNGSSATLSIVNSWSTATTASVVASANAVGANAGRFALEGHQHAGVFSFGVSNLGNTVGSTTVFPGQFVLAGGNNITLSQSTAAGNLATITISAGAGGAAGSNTFGMSNLGNTAGTSGTINGSAVQLLFAGGNNITLSQSINGSSATITISGANAGGGGAALSFWQNMDLGSATNNLAAQGSSNVTMRIFPITPNVIFPGDMTVNTMFLNASVSGSTATLSSSHSVTVDFGIYTLNGSTLSLLNSVRSSWARAAASNNSTGYQGQRFISFHSSQWSSQPVFRQGSIYIGALKMQSSNIAFQTWNWLGQYALSTAVRSGTVGVNLSSGNTTMGLNPFFGIYTSNTTGYSTGFPSSINMAAFSRGTASANFVPNIIFNNLLSSY